MPNGNKYAPRFLLKKDGRINQFDILSFFFRLESTWGVDKNLKSEEVGKIG